MSVPRSFSLIASGTTAWLAWCLWRGRSNLVSRLRHERQESLRRLRRHTLTAIRRPSWLTVPVQRAEGQHATVVFGDGRSIRIGVQHARSGLAILHLQSIAEYAVGKEVQA